jgi:hypothetical protein
MIDDKAKSFWDTIESIINNLYDAKEDLSSYAIAVGIELFFDTMEDKRVSYKIFKNKTNAKFTCHFCTMPIVISKLIEGEHAYIMAKPDIMKELPYMITEGEA